MDCTSSKVNFTVPDLLVFFCFPRVRFPHDFIFPNWSMKKGAAKIILLGVINDSPTYPLNSASILKLKTGA